MLKNLRNRKTAKKIWIILAALILPAFIFWGMGSAIRGKDESGYAGQVNGKMVDLREFKEAMEATRNLLLMRFGTGIPENIKNLDLQQQAWERIVLLAEAKRRGIKATDEEVVETIRSHPFFMRKSGFDSKTYYTILQHMLRIQPRAFEEQMRDNLILMKLYEQAVSNVSVSDEEIWQEYRKANQEIAISYIAANPADFARDLKPSDAELKDYFQANAAVFKEPPAFKLEYVVLDSEEDTRNLFIMLQKKEEFAKAAKKYALTVKETEFLNQTDPIPEIGWQPQIIDAAGQLKPGQYLPPLKMDKRYLILRLKEKRETRIPDLDAAKARVLASYKKEAGLKTAREKIENCRARLRENYANNPKAADFAKLASEFGLKYGQPPSFTFATYIEGIGSSDDFWLAADRLQPGGFSDIIPMPSGFYIIKARSKSTIDENKFREEKGEFGKKILLQKKNEKLALLLEELLKNSSFNAR